MTFKINGFLDIQIWEYCTVYPVFWLQISINSAHTVFLKFARRLPPGFPAATGALGTEPYLPGTDRELLPVGFGTDIWSWRPEAIRIHLPPGRAGVYSSTLY